MPSLPETPSIQRTPGNLEDAIDQVSRSGGKPRTRVRFLALFAGFLLLTQVGAQATLTVNSAADAGGICPGATCTLRQAILTAGSGDTINFAASLPTIDLTSGELAINKNLTLSGPGANLLTVRRSSASGTPSFRIFHIVAGNVSVTISGLTISQGGDSAFGGGIFNDGATLAITDCIISGNTTSSQNSTGNGGGIYNLNGTLNITHSTLSNNVALETGGAASNSGGTVTIEACVISGNSAPDPFGGSGGGIFNDNGGTVNITNSTLSNNIAPTVVSNFGGAIYNRNGTLTVTTSTLSNNKGDNGSGICNDNTGLATITASTISGNSGGSSRSQGGGIFNVGTLHIVRSTISGNHSDVGGGISNGSAGGTATIDSSTISGNSTNRGGGGISNLGSVVARNTIIAKNTFNFGGTPDFNGTLTSQGFNLIGDGSGATITPAQSTDQIGTTASPIDPMLGPLQDNGGPTFTMALLGGSPAIDQGADASDPSTGNPIITDQRGSQRPVDDPSITNASGGNGSDIGAVELSPIQFSQASYSVGEGAGVVTLTVTRVGDTSQAASVHYTTSDGTATAGSDYRGMSGDLVFASGETNKTFTIQILDDVVDEGDETFTVNLSSPVGADLGVSVAVVTIVDNDQAPTPTATPTPSPTPTPTATPTPLAKTLNISTRSRVQTGDNVMIGGFIVTGNASKKVIIRAIGPSLQKSGVTGVLADPVLELRGPDGSLMASDDNWKDNADQALQIQASGLPPQDDLESAIVATLPPAGYTAIVSGKSNGTGLGLVEVYDLDQGSDSKLANISTRALVETGNNVVIGGFILGGANGSPEMIVRAIGPSLAQLGVSNALADPTLELRDENGMLIAFDDNWKDNPAQAAKITAAGVQPQNDLEAAIASTLAPGAYTAIVAGKSGATGIGLVEVYNLQ